MMTTKMKKYFFIVCGLFFLLLGIIGIFLPLLPTTPFLILTALCFNKSSDKFHKWLINHRLLGPPILDWQQRRVIDKKNKLLASAMIFVSLAFILSKDTIQTFIKIGIVIFLTIILIIIWIQKSKPKHDIKKK